MRESNKIMSKLEFTEEKREKISSLALSICLFCGVLMLIFYIVVYGISSEIFPVFNYLSDSAAFGNMLALFVLSCALVRYEYSEKRGLSILYAVTIIIAAVAVSVQGNVAAITLMLFVPLLIAAYSKPIGIRIKRVLQIFFMEAILFSNLHFLYSYTDVIHTQGVSYFFESSIIGGLATAVFALIVIAEWDKLSHDGDISCAELWPLSKICRSVLKICAMLVEVSLIFGWDLGIIRNDVTVIFQRPDGASTEVGIIANVVFRLFCGINKAFSQAISGNEIGLFASRFGFVGVIVVGTVLVYLCYILYRHLKYSDKEWDALDLVAVVGLLQFMVLPVCMEMVLFYCVCIFCCAVRTTGWKLHFFRKEKGEETDLEEVQTDTEEV